MEMPPVALLQQFPRIANGLARMWGDKAALRQYLDELLIDRRGGRRGFPPEVHHELMMLREWCGDGGVDALERLLSHQRQRPAAGQVVDMCVVASEGLEPPTKGL
jgi:hypothetical protein